MPKGFTTTTRIRALERQVERFVENSLALSSSYRLVRNDAIHTEGEGVNIDSDGIGSEYLGHEEIGEYALNFCLQVRRNTSTMCRCLNETCGGL